MALGRGLGEILSDVEEAYGKDLSQMDGFEIEKEGAKVEEIDIENISPNPYQPRKNFDQVALQELSNSIRTHGLLQPIVVIKKSDGYLLVAGERRLRAHKLAKLTTIKAIIADVSIDEKRFRELALIENIQRENLNAIELAKSYAQLIDVHQITHDELSEIVHKSRSQITNTMRLLQLSAYAQEQLLHEKISQGHAKVLVGLDEMQQKIIIDSIIGQKLSVRESEKMVKRLKETQETPKKLKSPKRLFYGYEELLKQKLPYKYKIKSKSIEISFENQEEFKDFLEQLAFDK